MVIASITRRVLPGRAVDAWMARGLVVYQPTGKGGEGFTADSGQHANGAGTRARLQLSHEAGLRAGRDPQEKLGPRLRVAGVSQAGSAGHQEAWKMC